MTQPTNGWYGRVEHKLDTLIETTSRLEERSLTNHQVVADHETRLRGLERKFWGASGVAALVTAVGAFLGIKT